MTGHPNNSLRTHEPARFGQAAVGLSDMDAVAVEGGGGWRKSSHAWDDAALQKFEAAIYV